jgi:hypothetical protein
MGDFVFAVAAEKGPSLQINNEPPIFAFKAGGGANPPEYGRGLPSRIYAGVKANVWFYVPAQWNGVTPLAVQVWGDGQNYTGSRPGQWWLLETLDSLTAQKIPLMVKHFCPAPGTGAGRNQRSIEYDTVSESGGNFREC